jgi:hypothetical protein
MRYSPEVYVDAHNHKCYNLIGEDWVLMNRFESNSNIDLKGLSVILITIMIILFSPVRLFAQGVGKSATGGEIYFNHSKEWHPFYKDIHCKAVVNKDNKLLIYVKAVWNGKKFNGPINDKVVLEGYTDPKDEYFRKNETILASGCSDTAFYVVTNEKVISMPYTKIHLLYRAITNEKSVKMGEGYYFYSVYIDDGGQAIIDTTNNIVYILAKTKKTKNKKYDDIFEKFEKNINEGKIFVYSIIGKDADEGGISFKHIDKTFHFTDIEKIKLCKEGVCAYDSKGRYIGSIRYVYDPKVKGVVKVEKNYGYYYTGSMGLRKMR